MAKHKATRSKTQSRSVVRRIQGGIKQMQHEVTAPLTRARKEASRLFGEQKRALNRIVREAQRVRRDVERRAQHTAKDLEVRSRRLRSTLEKEAARRLESVIKRLAGRDLASRREVQSLSRRVQELEQLVKQHARTTARATTASSDG